MNKPIALDAFNQLAKDYLDFVDSKPHNAYYERPEMLELLDGIEILNKTVLDVGCAAGWYSNQLLERGANVISMDVSPSMIEYAKQRTKGKIETYVANLENPLSFVENQALDVILSSLTLHYVEDWKLPLSEFYRVLKPGGTIVLSTQHPMGDFKASKSGIYYDTELVDYMWKGMPSGPVSVPYYRRSLASMINSFIEAGFTIQKVVEPKPVELLKEVNERVYQNLSKEPAFICFKLLK